jgi:tetratricopeptide (TPR) repeat protein
MWDFLKKAGKQILQAGVEYAQNRAFILSLLQGSEADARRRLREAIHSLDEPRYNSFQATLSGMIGQAAQHLEQVKAAGGLGAWGNSFEDRMAQGLAEYRSGDHSLSSGVVRQAQLVLTSLQLIRQEAEAFRREQQQPVPASRPAARALRTPAEPDVAEIERMLEELGATGVMPEGLMEQLGQIKDPDLMERLVGKMKAMGAEEVGSGPLLQIKDYYIEGEEPYSLLWPLAGDDLPVPFEELDRETQFHVLWGENSYRLTEGGALRNAGKLDDAEEVFRECLERADQLEVPVLKAQAYDGLMSVAERRGDRKAAERYLKLVERERQRGVSGRR